MGFSQTIKKVMRLELFGSSVQCIFILFSKTSATFSFFKFLWTFILSFFVYLFCKNKVLLLLSPSYRLLRSLESISPYLYSGGALPTHWFLHEAIHEASGLNLSVICNNAFIKWISWSQLYVILVVITHLYKWGNASVYRLKVSWVSKLFIC